MPAGRSASNQRLAGLPIHAAFGSIRGTHPSLLIEHIRSRLEPRGQSPTPFERPPNSLGFTGLTKGSSLFSETQTAARARDKFLSIGYARAEDASDAARAADSDDAAPSAEHHRGTV